VSGSFDDRGQLDMGRGLVVTLIGKKRSGKSVMGLVLFRSYPGDRVVIDVAGDDGPTGPDVIDIHEKWGTSADEIPTGWPEHLRDGTKPMTLRYVPDPGSEDTELDDIDAVLAMAYRHGRCCVLIHEAGRVFVVHKTRPAARRILMHGRHHQITLINCMPRAKNVDLLVVGQADLVYGFEVTQQDDRDRIAETIGWPKRDYTEEIQALKAHEYTLFDANEDKPDNPHTDACPDDCQAHDDDHRLTSWPALPEDLVRDTLRWTQGYRPPPPGV
jgi:hypothetical protein